MEHHKSDLQTKRDRSEGPEGANKKQHMVACETDQDIGSKAAGEADQVRWYQLYVQHHGIATLNICQSTGNSDASSIVLRRQQLGHAGQ